MEIIVGVVLGLIVNETCDISPWLARKLVRWSATALYRDQERAEGRAEEWTALIHERPGKVCKLITALGFAACASWSRLHALTIENMMVRLAIRKAVKKTNFLVLTPINLEELDAKRTFIRRYLEEKYRHDGMSEDLAARTTDAAIVWLTKDVYTFALLLKWRERHPLTEQNRCRVVCLIMLSRLSYMIFDRQRRAVSDSETP